MSFHIISPILYYFFVESFRYIPTCSTSIAMKKCRRIHNIMLSILSFFMFVGTLYSLDNNKKLNSFDDFVCKPFASNDNFTRLNVNIFLYSKYLEWGDTLFLHLSEKKITPLQYTHHMSTALLAYLNIIDYISPAIMVSMGLNCLVHIPMYWYFAYPRGVLQQYRQSITRAQILQHILVLSSIAYGGYYHRLTATTTILGVNGSNTTEIYCEQNKYGYISALFLYLMYLIYFLLFYLSSYVKKIQ